MGRTSLLVSEALLERWFCVKGLDLASPVSYVEYYCRHINHTWAHAISIDLYFIITFMATCVAVISYLSCKMYSIFA